MPHLFFSSWLSPMVKNNGWVSTIDYWLESRLPGWMENKRALLALFIFYHFILLPVTFFLRHQHIQESGTNTTINLSPASQPTINHHRITMHTTSENPVARVIWEGSIPIQFIWDPTETQGRILEPYFVCEHWTPTRNTPKCLAVAQREGKETWADVFVDVSTLLTKSCLVRLKCRAVHTSPSSPVRSVETLPPNDLASHRTKVKCGSTTKASL